MADLIDAINADLPSPLSEMRVDGGMARSDPFLQFQADVLGLPLRRSPQVESTALGAALLAGLGVGLFPDPSSAAALLEAGGRAFDSGRDAAEAGAARHPRPLAKGRGDRPRPLIACA